MESQPKTQDKLKEEILKALSSSTPTTTKSLSDHLKEDHQTIVGICKSLEIKEVLLLEKEESKQISLTPEGKICLSKGAPEIQLQSELKSNGPQTKKSLIEKLTKPILDKGFSTLMKSKSIAYDKPTDTVTLKNAELPTKDLVKETLQKFSADPNPANYEEKLLKDYQKNMKLITIDTLKYFTIKKGPNFSTEDVKLETDLTTELLQDNKWEQIKFKKYNYNAMGKDVNNGALHRLLCVRQQIREIFLEQGFEEMKTNNFVESSFWNFDALFQPQQHPSRDAHDTFFLKNPEFSHIAKLEPEYFSKVKDIHENGGFGSIGWRYKWSPEIAEKNILRTHTTAISARTLYHLAQKMKEEKVFTPKKFFSIDRVFRNETLDNTHLAEFHQIEGFIADYNLGLGHLIGTIQDFFKRFGINKLRFKPAYNPYTEPSCEVYAWMDVSKRWVEIGNSGIFRTEMIKPMGLPDNVNVIAWGLSLERPTMIHYRLENIRDLFGHEVNIKGTQDASVYYLNEESNN